MERKKNALDEVMTFSEACNYINRSPSYFHNLVQTGVLKPGRDYRSAGATKLILKRVVEAYKRD